MSQLQPLVYQRWTEDVGVESAEEWRLLEEHHHAESGMESASEDSAFVDNNHHPQMKDNMG